MEEGINSEREDYIKSRESELWYCDDDVTASGSNTPPRYHTSAGMYTLHKHGKKKRDNVQEGGNESDGL